MYKTAPNQNEIPESPGDLDLLELKDSSGELTILLRIFHSKEILRIRFNGVLAYRAVPEGGRSRMINSLSPLRALISFSHSPFLNWLDEESSSLYNTSELVHHMISNTDNIIDVISGPSVEIERISDQFTVE